MAPGCQVIEQLHCSLPIGKNTPARKPLPPPPPPDAHEATMADGGGEDMIWLFDSITQFLKGPEW